MRDKHYPEPDIPADEAWAEMKNLLKDAPGKMSKDHFNKIYPRNFFLYAGAILIFASLIVYLLLPQKIEKEVDVTLHHSKNIPLKDTLSGGAVVFLDRNSTVIESTSTKNEKLIIIRGAAYFQNNTISKQSAHRLRTGSVDVLPVNAGVYLSFDSALSLSLVQVQSGKAILYANGEKLTLTAGEAVQYDEKTKRMSKKQQANISRYSYATMMFEFNDTPLIDAVESIEKAYGVSIIFENKKLYNCRITTKFDNKSVKEILDILGYTLNFQYLIDKQTDQIILTGDGCE